MPWTYRETVQFGLVVLCVPLQCYMSGYFQMYSTDVGRSKALLQTVKELDNFKNSWLKIESWQIIWQQLLTWVFKDVLDSVEVPEEETRAVEVLKYRERFFGLTGIVHNDRLENQKFRVGQVVFYENFNLKGVVINWELVKDGYYYTPNYKVLIDQKESINVFKNTHVVIQTTEQELDFLKHTQVFHPNLAELFIGFDGIQYIPRSWLKKQFPKD